MAHLSGWGTSQLVGNSNKIPLDPKTSGLIRLVSDKY